MADRADPVAHASPALVREVWRGFPRVTLTGHTAPVGQIAWGRVRGRPVLASASADSTVRLWDPETGRLRATLAGHERYVSHVAWGRVGDRPLLASCGGDPTVRLWDPETGRLRAALADHDGHVWHVVWGRVDSRPVLASASADAVVRLWDPETGELLASLLGHEGPVVHLAWSRRGSPPVLASAGADRTVRLWNPETGDLLVTLSGHTADVRHVTWGWDGEDLVFASASADGTVRLWNQDGGAPLATLTGHAGAVRRVAWGSVGSQPVLASVGDDSTVRLWAPFSGRLLTTLTDPVGMRDAAWGRVGDRPMIASAGMDGTVRLWDPDGGRPLGTLTESSGTVACVAWGRIGDVPVLASAGEDPTVRLWEIDVHRYTGIVPTYRSDDARDRGKAGAMQGAGPDPLDRDREAAALAELLCTRSARPPLAIGLFGDWGEGKSFFMHRVNAHVRRLSGLATGDETGDGLLHGAVRQVLFNAWHYAETDLWASLVTELFEQLNRQDTDPGDAQRRQSRLASQLVARRQIRERLAAARQRRQELDAKLEQARSGSSTPPQVAVLGAEAAKAYEETTATAGAAGRALRTAWFAVWDVGRAARQRWQLVLLAAVIVASMAALAVYGWVPTIVGWLAAAVGAVTAFIGPAREAWTNTALFRRRVMTAAARLRQWDEQRLAPLLTARDVAAAEVATLEAELRDLTAAGQLAGLAARRAGDADYRAQLGLMTRIREDFEEMARLLLAAETDLVRQTVGFTDPDPLPEIDRIILYIDDLDRCPPERVVAVLEAVQLLLAVELFAVVVAVDPRWLLRSLTVHYRDLLDPLPGAPEAPPDAAPSISSGQAIGAGHLGDDQDDIWESTPTQYLEKIFQVPLTLPPVTAEGYRAMVASLTVTPDAPSQQSGSGSPGGESSTPTPEDKRGQRTGQLIQPVTPGDEDDPSLSMPELPAPRIVDRADPLALSDDERRLLGLLGPGLVSTPRGVKRLVNSYGLLNAIRREQRERDLGVYTDMDSGEQWHPYRAAMVLLAALIGFPGESPALFEHLHHTAASSPQMSWHSFVQTLRPNRSARPGRWQNGCAGCLTGPQARRWAALADALEHVTAGAAATDETTDPLDLPEPLKAWAEWVVPVGRLSFQTGQVVTELHRRPKLPSAEPRPSPQAHHLDRSSPGTLA
ncbi:P-loop NTPase fold protein [Geodermatophilus sp. SYSU D00766]